MDGAPTTGATLKVTIADSEASNNFDAGVFALSSSGEAATAVLLRNVVASNNGIGLRTLANATLRIAHSVVTGNGTGLFASGGTLDSYGDNDIDGNTNNNFGLLTTIPTH